MIEKVSIKGKDIWIIVEPHIIHPPGNDAKEFFTASYQVLDPAATSTGGMLFLDGGGKPLVFESPVQALEYASEKLTDG